MSRQQSSDPLPYVQVDRAVKPKATLLANALGVTTQHATGSLVEFWELCGDPRELEAIVAATPPEEEPEVVLEPDDLRLRFKLASGHDLDPAVMARLGLVEPREQRFRVRGMSRYFEPIIRRLQARDAASKGGKASVETRRKRSGTAQPTGGKGSNSAEGAGSDSAQATAQAASEAEPKRHPKRNGSGDGSVTEAEPNPSGQRTADSTLKGQHHQGGVAAFEVAQPDVERIESWDAKEFWRAAELVRRAQGYPPQKWPHPIALARWWGEARAIADVAVLGEAFKRFCRDKYALERSPPAPFELWMTNWNNHLPRTT